MNFPVPPQAAFFYRGKWSREMDSLLLSTMITIRGGREWDDASATDEVLRNLRDVINPPFGANLTSEDVLIRVNFPKARYLTFKKVVRTNGAYWNMKEKFVEADESTWKLIFQIDASAAPYYYRDEPEFPFLASLFGLFDVKVEFPHEVITLSEGTEVIVLSETIVPDAPIRGQPYDSPADSDEVTSPMPGPSSRVRWKLFDVGGGCIDATSSTKSPSRFYPPKNVMLSSPKGSSCASWSPCPSSRKTGP